jgi:hypothetical protein
MIIVIATIGVAATRVTPTAPTRAPDEVTTIVATRSTMRSIVGRRCMTSGRSPMTLNKAHLKAEKVCVNLTQGHRISSRRDRCHKRVKLFRKPSEKIGHNPIIMKRCASSCQGISKVLDMVVVVGGL